MPRKESIELRAALLTGRFNDPLPDAEQPQWREIPGAVVVPRGSGDFQQRGPIIIKGFMIKLPAGVRDVNGEPVEIRDTDGVRVRGEIHEIDGAVGDYGKALIFYTIGVNVKKGDT